ncbi:MAG TPA: hypothetical protein VN823_05535 [Stellaceae bacterium]|nr:hypothetical protein [Stellaceae bacterium]
MPKRRSLVGTAHEAIEAAAKPPASSKPPAEPARTPKPRRAAPAKSKAAAEPRPERPAQQQAAAPTEVERPVQQQAAAPPAAAERMRAPFTGSAAAYEAMLGFASAAFRQNLETGAKLARCKSPIEAMATQTAHAVALTQSCIAVSLKLMQLGFSSASWASTPRPSARIDSH